MGPIKDLNGFVDEHETLVLALLASFLLVALV